MLCSPEPQAWVHNMWTGLAVAPTVVQNDDVDGPSILRDVSSGAYDSIVISPGPGTPHRASDVGECMCAWSPKTQYSSTLFAVHSLLPEEAVRINQIAV